MGDAVAAGAAMSTWRQALLEFDDNAHWASWRDHRRLRSLIVALHAVLEDTPDDLLQELDQFDEAELVVSAQCLTRHLEARCRCDAAGSDIQTLRHAATVLRALDMVLEESSETIYDQRPECWFDAEKVTYVVPIRRAAMQEGGARTMQNFARRGLLRHRIIPHKIKRTTIRIKPHIDESLINGPIDRVVGAALFEGFSLKYREAPGRKFVVTDANCAGGIDGAILRHCDAARAAGCDTIIWPELTIAPDRAKAIAGHLERAPLSTDVPAIVVAGSWHVKQGGHVRNLATVYNGRGDFMFEFGKNLRFSFDGLTENTAIHRAIHIVATDRELVAFAICKDFCDKAAKDPTPVRQLDVDLVLVPSMGQWKTMTAHRDAADDMKVRYGTRTAVVQQAYPRGDDDPAGFVLRLPIEPLSKERADLVERLEFSTFQRERVDPRSAAAHGRGL